MRVGVDAPARTGAGSGGNLAVDKGDAGGAAGWRIGADRQLYFLPLSRPRIQRKPTMARSLCRAGVMSSRPQGGAPPIAYSARLVAGPAFTGSLVPRVG